MSISAVAAVLKHSRATKSARLVLVSIAQSVEQGQATTKWIGIDKIAARAGMSGRQVKRILHHLELLGELEIITPDMTGGPGYVRAIGFRTANGRGLANKYRIRLQKGDIPTPFQQKGDKMSSIVEKGDKIDEKGCHLNVSKGDTAMSYQRSERISEGGGDTPPCTPGREVGTAAPEAPSPSASAASPPQALLSGLTPTQRYLIEQGKGEAYIDANGETAYRSFTKRSGQPTTMLTR